MNPPQRIPGDKIAELVDRLLDRRDGAADVSVSIPTTNGGARALKCPEDQVWRELAARQESDERSQALIEHAAGCRHCGAILNFWASMLPDEETAEESSALNRLSSMTPAWQERMTMRLSAAGRTQESGALHGRFVWPAILGVAGALAATTLLFLFLHGSHTQASPENLLAQAYSDHRTMEMRIPLAGFAQVDSAHHRRAAGADTLSDSVPLLEARAAITQALMKTPEDPHWLLLQARSDLLNENYDSAIDTLKRLLAGDPKNVAVLTDLASAYSMRAKATDVVSDEATALDYLEQASRLVPQDPVVLYNEAVVLQDIFQYSNAIEVWKRFLAVEQNAAWAADGKRRMDEIVAREAKVKAQQSRLDPFLGSPEGMLHLARSPAIVAEYDEELSSDFLPLLLKTAFPASSSSNSSASDLPSHPTECTESCGAARALLQAVAVSLQEHHGDRWLSELLAGSAKPGFALAAGSLAAAITDGVHASPADALKEAHGAQEAFERSGNPAGVALTRTEEIYDLEHLLDARGCLAAAQDLPSLMARSGYKWMEARAWADQAICYARQNDFSAAKAGLRRSIQISTDAGYRILHLRAYGLLAGEEEGIGNRDLSWKMNLQTLQTYWDGNYPMVRRVQPYANLAYAEQTSTRFYTAAMLRRETVDEAALFSNLEQLNANRYLLVKAEIRAGEMQEASRDLALSEAELVTLPGHSSPRRTAADIAIFLAEAYLGRNDLPAASGMLQKAAANMDRTGNSESGNRYMELRYAAASGHLALLEGRLSEAEDELTRAVAMDELSYQEMRVAQDRLDWIANSRGIYAALSLLRLREGKDPLEALAIWERYRVLSSSVPLEKWCHGRDLTCLAKPLDAVRKTLKQQTVLGTVRLDRTLLVWTMDDRGIQFREVNVDPDRFDRLCHTFFETVATPTSSEASIRLYGDRLAGSLLTPVASALDPHRTLIFDLDDSMEFLPMSALPVNGKYIGQQFATSVVHSVLLAGSQPLPTGTSRQSIVVGASNPGDPEVPRLPEAKAEALAVAGFLVQPKVFVGGDAVASSIEAAAPHAALIHFAGHTRYSDEGTRLLLAQPANNGPDWLDASAFRSHAFANCRLVVLSACSTGKREERDSDDIQDIVQTLTADGAQQIVATHWDVDSAASVSLMKDFYSELARGLTVPQALLHAENTVSATTEYRHPYYWAPYYVTGMSRSNLKELLHDD